MYINLIFDIYEIYNQELKTKLSKIRSFEEATVLCDEKFEEVSLIVDKMKKETNLGLDYQNLVRWKTTINQKLYPEI